MGLLGLLALLRFRRLGVGLLVASLVSFSVVSVPVVATALQRLVQIYPALSDLDSVASRAGAIVVLGGGRYRDAPEYGGDTVSVYSLSRVRYGAWLHKATGLPLLVTGGNIFEERRPEADLMADTLQREFGVPVRWRETKSRNTEENALFSAQILKRAGITAVVLVTHASHMRRGTQMFLDRGLDVLPAPTRLLTPRTEPYTWMDFFPHAWAMKDSRAALHELLGIAWYRLRSAWS